MQDSKLAVMQPYFFPYIGYFQLISAVDTFLLYDHVDYIKRGWINRNRLLEIHRGPVYFGFKVEHVHPGTLIREVRIKFGDKERKKLLKDIYHNYHRALYFQETFPLIEKALPESAETIAQINGHSIAILAEYLDIRTKILFELEAAERIELGLQKSPEVVPSPIGKPDRKTQRIINICNEFNCSNYVNPIGGQQIYSPEVFRRQGININFIQTLPYSYTQPVDQFHRDLSIIDVLMNCGKENTRTLLRQFRLI
jgi:hypothetical protein